MYYKGLNGFEESPLPESNQRPTDYKSVALPAELRRPKEGAKIAEVLVFTSLPYRFQKF